MVGLAVMWSYSQAHCYHPEVYHSYLPMITIVYLLKNNLTQVFSIFETSSHLSYISYKQAHLKLTETFTISTVCHFFFFLIYLIMCDICYSIFHVDHSVSVMCSLTTSCAGIFLTLEQSR